MTLRVEAAGSATILTIDRPKAKNAIDRAMAKRLGEAIREASNDRSVRGVIITGGGHDTFVSGGDLKEIARLVGDEGGARNVLDFGGDLSACETCDVPVIAAVQGDALGGGCELLMLCDLVIIEAHAGLSFRHAKMGLSPAWGGITRLTERTGALEAARLLFTAERVGAEEARRIGLANEVVEKGAARARAIERVSRIAESTRDSVAAIKRALYATRQARRGDSIEREQAVFAERWGKDDHLAAIEAFMNRK